jgi:hypothetical protein
MLERRVRRGFEMTSRENGEMEEEQRISMREEQVIFFPKKGRNKVINHETVRNTQETKIQKMEKLIALLKELGGNKFFSKLLIKFESGQIIPVRKMQYIQLSRSNPGEEPVNTTRPAASKRDDR